MSEDRFSTEAPPRPPLMPRVTFGKASGSRMREKFTLGFAVPHTPVVLKYPIGSEKRSLKAIAQPFPP